MIVVVLSIALCANTLSVFDYKRATNGRGNIEVWDIFDHHDILLFSSTTRVGDAYKVSVPNSDSFKLQLRSLDGTFSKNSWIMLSLNNRIVFRSYFKEGNYSLALRWNYGPDNTYFYSLTYEHEWYQHENTEWSHYGPLSRPPAEQQSLVWYFSAPIITSDPIVAYHVLFNYQYGIIAYINSREVFRDNMPEGPAIPNSPSSGRHSVEDLRGAVRNGYDITNDGLTINKIAVEVHFQEPTHYNTFQLYFIPLHSAFPESDAVHQCAVLPYEETLQVFDSGVEIANSLHEWGLGLPISLSSLSSSTYILYDRDISIQPSAWHIITTSSCAITKFELQMRRSETSEWITHPSQSIDPQQYRVGENEYIIFLNQLFFHSQQAIRWVPLSTNCTPVHIQKFHSLVCKRNVPIVEGTLVLEPAIIAYQNQPVSISPISKEGSITCRTSTALPAGLTLTLDCVLSGTPTELFTKGTVDVFWHDSISPHFTTFILEVVPEDESDGGLLLLISGIVVVILVAAAVVGYVKCYKKRPHLPIKKKEKEEDNQKIEGTEKEDTGDMVTIPSQDSQSVENKEDTGDMVTIPSQDGQSVENKEDTGDVVTIPSHNGQSVENKEDTGDVVTIPSQDGQSHMGGSTDRGERNDGIKRVSTDRHLSPSIFGHSSSDNQSMYYDQNSHHLSLLNTQPTSLNSLYDNHMVSLDYHQSHHSIHSQSLPHRLGAMGQSKWIPPSPSQSLDMTDTISTTGYRITQNTHSSIPQNIHQNIHQDIPQNIPQNIPQDIPQGIPQDTHQFGQNPLPGESPALINPNIPIDAQTINSSLPAQTTISPSECPSSPPQPTSNSPASPNAMYYATTKPAEVKTIDSTNPLPTTLPDGRDISAQMKVPLGTRVVSMKIPLQDRLSFPQPVPQQLQASINSSSAVDHHDQDSQSVMSLQTRNSSFYRNDAQNLNNGRLYDDSMTIANENIPLSPSASVPSSPQSTILTDPSSLSESNPPVAVSIPIPNPSPSAPVPASNRMSFKVPIIPHGNLSSASNQQQYPLPPPPSSISPSLTSTASTTSIPNPTPLSRGLGKPSTQQLPPIKTHLRDINPSSPSPSPSFISIPPFRGQGNLSTPSSSPSISNAKSRRSLPPPPPPPPPSLAYSSRSAISGRSQPSAIACPSNSAPPLNQSLNSVQSTNSEEMSFVVRH